MPVRRVRMVRIKVSIKDMVGRTLIIWLQHLMLPLSHPPLLLEVAAPIVVRDATTDKITVDLKMLANMKGGERRQASRGQRGQCNQRLWRVE